jgi:hypothetical protein
MSERQKSICLDAAALVGMVYRGETAEITLMLTSYDEVEELRELAAALTGCAGTMLRAASEASGVPPEKFLGYMVANVRAAA